MQIEISDYERDLLIEAITGSHLPTKRSLSNILKMLKNDKNS